MFPPVSTLSFCFAYDIFWYYKTNKKFFFLFNIIRCIIPYGLCFFLIFYYDSISCTKTINIFNIQFSSVQSLSLVQIFATPWTAARQASLSITNSRSSPKLMSIELWCHPAISSSVVPFSSCPQSFPASGYSIRAGRGHATGLPGSTPDQVLNSKFTWKILL